MYSIGESQSKLYAHSVHKSVPIQKRSMHLRTISRSGALANRETHLHLVDSIVAALTGCRLDFSSPHLLYIVPNLNPQL